VGEESRHYRWLGQLAPALAGAFWRTQTAAIQRFNVRTAFLLESLDSASSIISRSNFLKSVYVEAGVKADRIQLSRQGRDFPNLTADLLAKKLSPVLRIGYLGQIAAHKGVHILLSAARHLADATLTVRVYGDPASFAWYTASLRRVIGTDARLQLAGLCRPEDLDKVFQNIDVLVVPSLWYENSPNVILEAFAHGTPVIASDLGGMSELVQDEKNGLLFAPGDALSLARQLQRLLDGPDLMPRLRQGIASIKSLAQELDELEHLYRSVLGQQIARQAASQPVVTAA
jgi:glycosyltransferase involved in cell wall biosynthesis